MRGTVSEIPNMRTTVYWALCWDHPIHGDCQVLQVEYHKP